MAAAYAASDMGSVVATVEPLCIAMIGVRTAAIVAGGLVVAIVLACPSSHTAYYE